jgi:hypothetical protein
MAVIAWYGNCQCGCSLSSQRLLCCSIMCCSQLLVLVHMLADGHHAVVCLPIGQQSGASHNIT